MNLKIKHFLFLIFTVFSGLVQAQTKSINTSNIDFRFAEGKIYITYDIVNSAHNELYTINVSVFRENGGKLNAVSLSGDLKEINGGAGKTIIWEQRKDGYVLDEKIYVSLAIAPKVAIPVLTHILKSAVYPGWGDYKIRNGKYHFIYGVAGLSAIGASIYMNSQAQKNYTNYKNSLVYSESNSLFNKAKQQQSLSYIFAGTACLVWTIDLASLYSKTNKVKKQITKENSKYYYEKSQQTNSLSSSLNAINTKLPYDLALERGDKLLLDEKYEQVKIAYEEAYKYDATETVTNKLVSINRLIEEAKNKTITYNSNIAKGQALMAQKQYKEAIVEFESASRIEPKEKYPLNKIDEINQILNQIENQKLYDAQMAQGSAYLSNRNFETANTFFKTALTYKPDDITAINKCKECDNGIAVIEQKRVDKEYKQKMKQGDLAYSQKKYDLAIDSYVQAQGLKPNQAEPGNKIAECNGAIFEEKTKENNIKYKKLINQADVAYNNKQFDYARTLYIQAQNLMPNESYPTIRISSINKKMENGGDESDMSSIYEKCKTSVFYIMVLGVDYWDEVKVKSQGSGFFISSNGIGVSNYHVINKNNYENSVVVLDKDNVFEIEKILVEDSELDYVIFKVKTKGKSVPHLKVSNTEPKITNKVFAIGNPEGLSRRYTPGVVNGFEPSSDDRREIATDVGITHGSSGGPLFNMKGEVVGITSGGHGFQGGNFNVAVNIQKTACLQYAK